MADGVDVNVEPFVEPSLEMALVGLDEAGKNADGRAAIYLLESIDNRAEVCLVLLMIAHIIDTQYRDRVYARLTNPLLGDELWEIAMNIVGIEII